MQVLISTILYKIVIETVTWIFELKMPDLHETGFDKWKVSSWLKNTKFTNNIVVSH